MVPWPYIHKLWNIPTVGDRIRYHEAFRSCDDGVPRKVKVRFRHGDLVIHRKATRLAANHLDLDFLSLAILFEIFVFKSPHYNFLYSGISFISIAPWHCLVSSTFFHVVNLSMHRGPDYERRRLFYITLGIWSSGCYQVMSSKPNLDHSPGDFKSDCNVQ